MIAGMGGVGELAMSMGGLLKDVLIGFGDTAIDVMSFGLNMAFSILDAGWHFAGKFLTFLGPLIVKFFEGALWLAKFLFDGLGKVILAGFKLAVAGLKMAGKLFVKGVVGMGKLLVGGLKM